jgi:hypothetical protein
VNKLPTLLLAFASLFIGHVSASAPANDAFTNRAFIRADHITITADDSNATLEPDEPTQPYAAAASLWWSWTAPNDGFLDIETTGSAVTPSFAVYTGDSLTNLHIIDFSDFRCARLSQFATPTLSQHEFFRVSSNTTYQLAFASPSNLFGPFQFALTFSTVQITNPTDGAILLKAPIIPLQVTTRDAHNAIATMAVELDGILSRAAPPPLLPDGAAYTLYLRDLLAGPHTARVQLIRTGAVTNYSPLISFNLRPLNDDIANAIVLTGTNIAAAGDLAWATTEPAEIPPSGISGSVWYRWKFDRDGIVRIKTSSYRIPISVQVKDSQGTMHAIAFNSSLRPMMNSDVLPVLQIPYYSFSELYIQFSQFQEPKILRSIGPCDPPWYGPSALPFDFTLQWIDSSIGPLDLIMPPKSVFQPPLPDSVICVFAASFPYQYLIKASTNLITWETVALGYTQGGSETVYLPSNLAAPQRYFKVDFAP